MISRLAEREAGVDAKAPLAPSQFGNVTLARSAANVALLFDLLIDAAAVV
jgi:hypothetical protein